MSTPRRRARDDRGIAVVMTSLALLPMMIFAAFGVDLASWYSQVSVIQKAADAASLAGTVWMPDLTKATNVACESLARNGISGAPDCGSAGKYVVDVSRGVDGDRALLVSITDTNAKRYFSQVFRGSQSLTRTSEAEYNMPLPLGSPLNYFGGDASTSTPPPPDPVYSVSWPTDYSSRTPTNAPCNVGSDPAHLLGRWSSGPSFEAGQHHSSGTGNRLCTWAPVTESVNTTFYSNANATTLAPSNSPCNRRQSPNTSLGRWAAGPPPAYTAGTTTTNGRFSGTAAAGNRQCNWTVVDDAAGTLPAGYNAGFPPPSAACPCNVSGYGRWTASPGGYEANQAYNSGTDNRLCVWTATVLTTTPPTPPNPIPSDRNPGFWAMIYGPGQYAANGDAYSARCTTQFNCSSVENLQYRPLSSSNRGYWYVVSIPTGVSGSVDINVFDAAYNHVEPARIMDSVEGTGTPDFETEFRVFKQTNPLDFNMRSDLFTASNSNPVDGGCWWKLRKESGFHAAWSKLCTIASVQGGDTYLVNVRTNTVGAANEAGNNGYAIEAVLGGGTGANRYANPGPSIYAYADMAIANQNQCPSGTCDGTFYLAKVGPQFAGKTLIIDLYDGGDSTGAGISTMYPMKPSPTAVLPSVNVPAADCSFTATPDPNVYIDTSDLRIHTGERRVTSMTGPDSGDGNCGIRATNAGVRQFNGEWLRVRVSIPASYNCDVTRNNPQTQTNTCWWGIRYRFQGNASDTTTWKASIEGNPVHLTS